MLIAKKLGLLCALLLFSFGLLALDRWLTPPETPVIAQREMDAFGKQIRSMTFDLNGEPKNIMMSPYVAHYSQEPKMTLLKPQLLIFTPPKTPWQVQAQLGTYREDRNRLDLNGEAHIERAAGAYNAAFSLQSKTLCYEPNLDRLSTPDPVAITQGHDRLRATGLEAHFKPETMELLANVQMGTNDTG